MFKCKVDGCPDFRDCCRDCPDYKCCNISCLATPETCGDSYFAVTESLPVYFETTSQPNYAHL